MDIATCRKGAVPGTCDDNTPHLIVRTHVRDRVVQFRTQLTVHGVKFVWTIQGKNRHAMCLFDQDILVSHACLLQITGAMLVWWIAPLSCWSAIVGVAAGRVKSRDLSMSVVSFESTDDLRPAHAPAVRAPVPG